MTTQSQGNTGGDAGNAETREEVAAREIDVITDELSPEVRAGQQSDSDTNGDDTASQDDKAKGANGQDSDTGAPKDDRRTKRSADRKIRRLTRKLSAKDRQIQNLERRLTDLEQKQSQGGDDNPEPDPDDFEDKKEYGKAYAKWEREQQQAQQQQRQQQQRQQQQQRGGDAPQPDAEVAAFIKRGKKQLGDQFQEALQDEETAVSQVMGEFLMDSEHGPELYVHLANNPEEARKIYDSSEGRATKALEALEAKAQKGELDVDYEEGQLQVDKSSPGDDDGAGSQDDDAGKGDNAAGTRTSAKKTRAAEPPDDSSDGTSKTQGKSPEDESTDEYIRRRKKETGRPVFN